MGKLTSLQELVDNDLRVFRERFFSGMAPLSAEEYAWRVGSLERFESFRISGIVGGRNPSHYSESPSLWNPYFRELGIEGVFFAFDLPLGASLLSFLECWTRTPGALDLTVTDPFKQEACRMLRSLPLPVVSTAQVEETGTVNHLVLDDSSRRLIALNTDGLGMVRALRRHMNLEGKEALLLGAGGSAASIGAELLRCRCRLWIANRTASRARDLADSLRNGLSRGGGGCPEVHWSGFDGIEDLLPGVDLLINTVSAGCPVGPAQTARLPAGAVLAESKYGAKADLTGLARGRIYVDGRAMLFGQFVEAAEVVRSVLGVAENTHRDALCFFQDDR